MESLNEVNSASLIDSVIDSLASTEEIKKLTYLDLNDIINNCGYNLKTIKIISFNYLFFLLMGYILDSFAIISVSFQSF